MEKLNMTNSELTLLGITLIFFILLWVGSIYIKYLRSKRHNTQLWGTIFEGVTNKLINLDAIKEPEVFIEKKAKRSGQEKDEEQSDSQNEEKNKQ
jgi:phosphate starvation-inducible membrane PsiE